MNLKTIITAMALTATMSASAQFGAGIMEENLDKQVKLGDDFYRYACGGWMASHPLPAAYSRYGSFDKLGEDNTKRINSILTELAGKTYDMGTTEQKVSDLYKLAMDSVRRNKEGVAPILPYMKRIEQCKTVEDVKEYMYSRNPYGDFLVASMYFYTDQKDSEKNILYVSQGGLSLGQKDYYVNTDEATLEIMAAYRKHIVKMFTMVGYSEAEATKKMEAVLDLETTLAKASKSRTEMRDVEKNYNKVGLKQFIKDYPNYPLCGQLVAMGIDLRECEQLILGQPEFMKVLDGLMTTVPAEQWKAYLQWRLLRSAASTLSDDIIAESFDFNGRVMSGRTEDHPRWKKATNLVQSVLGMPLGKIYCDRYFNAASKERMVKLVKNLQVALGERIDAQEWMTPETKKVAHEKLDAFYVKIGYPDTWDDYSALVIDPQKSLLENLMEADRFETKKELDETVGKPVDRTKWQMTPQTVNAYYNPTSNEICFPAGILQYPFFDTNADDAFNYGAIGVVIGHEMTHGFDDQGSHYDKNGNMTDWWTPTDVENFKKLGDMYADFFSQIDILPGLKANGRMTLGENLADHGGLQVAYQAYKNAQREALATGSEAAKADAGVKLGHTADQRFFLAYSGVWGQNITEKEIRNRLVNDVHSQGEWRVNGALPHINAWYEAFGIKPSDKLYLDPAKRLNLW